jgi:hypothetical protein
MFSWVSTAMSQLSWYSIFQRAEGTQRKTPDDSGHGNLNALTVRIEPNLEWNGGNSIVQLDVVLFQRPETARNDSRQVSVVIRFQLNVD